jgi:hypothetical protein
MFPPTGGLAGQGRGGRLREPQGGEPFTRVGATTISASIARPDDEAGAAPVIQAEWALWGKDEQRTALHVLRCSNGALNGDDFRDLFTRYATGVKEELPQYTVYWIPSDGQRRPVYLAVGIHELADPDPERAGGRRQNVAGRIVEYVRLFCFRYADVAKLEASYAGLVNAVRDVQLLPSQSEPMRVQLPSRGDPPATDGPAELVASLLLTSRPVCVLAADHLPAWQRLDFIDEVLAQLPFGLRATLSASTWASPTVDDLKLRLFFSSARRGDSTRTCHVNWEHPDLSTVPPGKFEALEFYQEWLREASESARAALSGMKDPVRFDDDDIGRALGQLPRNKSLADTFAELTASLQTGDQDAVSVALKPLRPYLKRTLEPGDRAVYRNLVEQHQLLANHPELHHSTQASLYNTLLKLAYGGKVSYPDYRGIERAAGGKLSVRLQTALVDKCDLGALPYILAANAGPGYPEQEVMEKLQALGITPGHLLSEVYQQIEAVQPRHQLIVGDFAVRYLYAYGADVRQELLSRGYLSDLFTLIYPEDQQWHQLEAALRQAYGNRKLAKDDIVEVFAHTWVKTAGPIEEVVKSLTKLKLRHLVEREAADAWLTQEGHGALVAKLRQDRRRRAQRRRPQLRHQSQPRRRPQLRHAHAGLPGDLPNTFLMVPTKNIKNMGIVLLGVISVIVVVYVVIHVAGG